MKKHIFGKKIGMTQVFSSNNKVVPVTVIDISSWIVLQKKDISHDGYNAVQIGLVRNKYKKKDFSLDWLKNKAKYFAFVREVVSDSSDSLEVGSVFVMPSSLSEGSVVDVSGRTIGKGFQGVVKRHGYSGGRASHGDKLGRNPGAIGGLRTQGKVFKGKKMPGHDGCVMTTVSNMHVVKYMPEDGIVLVKGSVPGKSGSLLCIRNVRAQ